MKKAILLLAVFLLTASACNRPGTKSEEFNFGFEHTPPNQKLADGWFDWGRGYDLCIDTTIKYKGQKSVRIQSRDKRVTGAFGCAAYKIPVEYEGRAIELKAYMKLQEVKDGPAGLLLRIDGESGILQFDNMQQENIHGTSDWTLYSIQLPLSRYAKTIYIGAVLSGTGKIWVDDFELTIDGKDIRKADKKKQKIYKAWKDNEFDDGSKIDSIRLTEAKINDLQVLGLVWGFLNYYHPAVASGDYNWDYELFRILPKVIDANNAKERDKILTGWIKSLGKFKVAEKSKQTANEIKLKPDLDWITNSNFSEELTSQLLMVKNAIRTDEHFYIKLVEGVGNPQFTNIVTYPEMKYPDAGFRLLSLYRYWNIIHYFFPYRNLMEGDWKADLKEFIPKYLHASNEIEYTLAVLEAIGRVHDSHANIWGQNDALQKYLGLNYSVVQISFIENEAVVTGFFDKEMGKATGLRIGDIISSVNSIPAEKIVLQRLKYAPASNYPTQLRNLAYDFLRTNEASLRVGYSRPGAAGERTISAYSMDRLNVYRRYMAEDTCFKLIGHNIAYLYPGTMKNEYLPEIMARVQRTRGLVIDLRCYPSDFIVFSLGKYLMPDSVAFVKFSEGSVISPGQFTFTPGLQVGEENKDYYKGKVVILVNEVTQSNAEYTTMAFRVAPGAIVLGSTTAGADGNVSSIGLPGGIQTMISGIGVYYPDGKETQCIGIVPDIELRPTIRGIREGRDEVLEKAIEVINRK